jgi:hypothetical protein
MTNIELTSQYTMYRGGSLCSRQVGFMGPTPKLSLWFTSKTDKQEQTFTIAAFIAVLYSKMLLNFFKIYKSENI